MILTIQDIDSNLINIIERCKRLEPASTPMFEIMYHCGVRVQEATTPQLWDDLDGTHLVLKPQKYNDIRIFKNEDIPDSFRNFLKYSKNWLIKPNYDRINYIYSLLTMYPSVYVGRKKCTNHLFRHNYVKKLIAKGMTDEQIRIHMGERQMKSALAYINSIFTTVPQLN
ncbi:MULTISPECIES: hypothetical protein [unclassified Proteiniphilum]|jgi:site-specific recombinase XerD|uniref:hypothetical protein n=2 Tax=Proteiniphilum TaxID=294702 RepID=UPI002579ADF5|nr:MULTISPECIES: hypothetical protein [unclassified Proteiniphilum]